MKREDYVFASTRIRLFERDLLTEQNYDELLKEKSLDSACKKLDNTWYGKFFRDEDPNQYEDSLTKANQAIFKQVINSIPSEDALDLYFLKFKYHNLKVVAKSELFDENIMNLTLDLGENVDEFKYVLKHPELFISVENGITRDAMKEVLEDYKKHKNPQRIDIILDKFYFEEMKEKARSLKSKIINDYIKDMIDVANFEAFIRIRQQKRDPAFLGFCLIEGGKTSKNFFLDNLNKSLEDLIRSKIYKSDLLKSALLRGGEESSLLGNLDYELSQKFINKAKEVSYGPEVVLSYLLKRDNEISNLRMIMVSKKNNISQEMLEGRLYIYG